MQEHNENLELFLVVIISLIIIPFIPICWYVAYNEIKDYIKKRKA